jgi:outer membrane protein TolC
MARSELVQAQAEVANRRLTLASSENAADQARLTLIGLLNMDRTTQIVPVEPIELVEVDLDFKRFFDIALVERPDYLQAKFGAENSAMNKRLADNNSQWTLNLTATAGINNQADRWLEPLPPGRYDEDWSAGVNLIIPLFDRSLRAQRVQADVAVLQSKNSVVDLRQQIGREITDAIRNTEISRSQVDLARQSRQLSEEQLAIETEKLRLGRSTNFRVIDFQTDLLTAQINETSSVAAYLNALTDLDLTLGTTLETWQIELQRLPIPSGL